jgi:hypothetical protein
VDATGGLSVSNYLGAPTTYNAGFFSALVPVFERLVYPFSPVITPGEIKDAISNMESSFEDAALVYAFGSATILHTQERGRSIEDISVHIDGMVNYSYEALQRSNPSNGPSRQLLGKPPINLKSIMTYLYLEISMTALGNFDLGFIFLREAIAMLQICEKRTFPLEGGESSKY